MAKRKPIFGIIITYALVLIAMLFIAIWGSRGVTVFTETAPLQGRRTIIIDAGHGYPDGGTTSCTGVLECTINLEIAQRLDDLSHLLGIETLMVRNSPESVYTDGNTIGAKKVSDLKYRVNLINKTENAVLVSIHQNYFQDSKYSGAQVFYRESAQSKGLANLLQKSFIENLNPGSNRQVKKASGIYLMEHVDCTAVLVECGFLSNPEEEFLLRSKDYQKKICCVLASTLSLYRADSD